ncbi:hypothetical protein KHQ08_12650 [Pseudochrobactrum algeriensis]|uniref:hypothetical protein n=1 Tax=Pseudochrobactrum algeriensis TaxID=2834768 RepID=UPI001BD63FCA|nr:hypothetical protein [Pseudochrobactrum algeriensis]QVQ36027.1 hypothetical protein KHQ08_12650 [Pseudochrobactrum algeriensis]
MDNSQYISLSRRFVEIQSTDFENEPDSIWASLAMRKTGKTWEEILSNDVSILLGTAGSGKTTEVRQQVQHLVEAGQDAFLMRLEALQDDSLVGSFDFGLDDQGERFDIWKRSKKVEFCFLTLWMRLVYLRHAMKVRLRKPSTLFREKSDDDWDLYML